MKQNWEYKHIGDICNKGSSNLMQKHLYISDNGFEVFGASGSLGKINFYQQSEPYIGIVKDGSGVGRCNLYPAKTSLLGTMQYILAKECVTNAYLCYLLQSLNLSKYANGAAIPHIYFRDYKNEIVPVPPMEIQVQIVAELDKINETIEDCRELLRNLDALAQSLFYDYFGDPITNPQNWVLKTLGTISAVLGGSTPKTNITEYWNGDLCWITPAELKGEKYIYDTERHITDFGRASSGLLLFPKNTILLTSRAPIGKVAIAKVPMYCNQGFKNLICDAKQVHFQYVYFFLSLITDVLNEKGSGATFREISKRVTESISIPVPPLELQEKFAERIEQIDAQKKDIEETIANLQTLLDSRIDYWFN